MTEAPTPASTTTADPRRSNEPKRTKFTREKYFNEGFELGTDEFERLVADIEASALRLCQSEIDLDFTVMDGNGHEELVHSCKDVVKAAHPGKNRIVSVRMTAHAKNDKRDCDQLDWFIYFDFRECKFTERRKNSFAYRVSATDKDWVTSTAERLDKRFQSARRTRRVRSLWTLPRVVVVAAVVACFAFFVMALAPQPDIATALELKRAADPTIDPVQALIFVEHFRSDHWMSARLRSACLALAPIILFAAALIAAWLVPVHEFHFGEQKRHYDLYVRLRGYAFQTVSATLIWLFGVYVAPIVTPLLPKFFE
jgi:hypothetical protein